MDRRAVATTIASVVIFTTILLANAAVYSAQNSYLGAVTLSGAQVQEHDYALVLVGLSSFSSLARVQSFLQSTPMDCSSVGPYLDSLSGSADLAGDNQSILYDAASSWSSLPAAGPVQGDALLPPVFNGYVGGELNLRVVTDVSETFDGGLPSYSDQSIEVVHLSVQPERMASECLSALSELRAALASVSSCDSKAVEQGLTEARDGSGFLESFETGASATPESGRCLVSYWVSTTETGIPGVSGTFQWTVSGSGFLSILQGPVSVPFAA